MLRSHALGHHFLAKTRRPDCSRPFPRKPLQSVTSWAPREAGRFARGPNTICVAVEPVASIRDDREVLVLGRGVGGAAGTDGTLNCHLVWVVARLVLSAGVVPAPLIDQHDSARPRCDRHRVAGHLHILRRSNTISAPQNQPLFAHYAAPHCCGSPP